jgi:V8-like Glu-specific endopeptidase
VPPAISLVVAVSLLTSAAVVTGGQPAAAAARPGGSAPGPASGTSHAVSGAAHAVSGAAQRAARAFWTPARMTRAIAADDPAADDRAAQDHARKASPPPGTPTATPFAGVPTIGVLFYTTGSGVHSCTASVVDSAYEDLIVTAAHCVYARGFATSIEFVPGYHDGHRPYGVWLVQAVVVATAWRQRHDPGLDFAFLTVAAPGHPGRRIQRVTGGLRLGIGRGYAHWIALIGYNDAHLKTADPVRCANHSLEFRPGQMVFYCHGYWNGTSGGPWVVGFTSRGAGTLIGVIGGYQDGGDYDWASYSPVLGPAALALYRRAEAAAVR